MKLKKIFVVSLSFIIIGLIGIPSQKTPTLNNTLIESQTKSWTDVEIDYLNSKVVFSEEIPNRLTVNLKVNNLNSTDSTNDCKSNQYWRGLGD